MVKKLIFSAVIVVLCGVSITAEARSVVRFDNEVTVADKQAAEGDFYSISSKAAISGNISGDAHVVAGKVDIRGTVASDTLAVGATVTVDGEIGDDLRVIGADVTIAGHVRGDLMVIAQTLTILEEARIDGDVIFFGHEGTISGTVGHDVFGRVTTLRIDGPVAGTVDVAVGSLTLGDKAAVTGNVQYESVDELVRAPNASVAGEVVRTDPVVTTSNSFAWPSALVVFLTLVLIVGAWHLVSRRSLKQIASRSVEKPIWVLVVGVLTLLVMFFMIASFFVLAVTFDSVAGVIALLIATCYVSVIVIAVVMSPVVLGEVVRSVAFPKQAFGVEWILIGALVFTWLLFLSPVTVVVLVPLIFVALGSFCEYLYQQIR